MREDDDEPPKQILLREREHNSKWFQLLSSDLTSRKVLFEKAKSLASNKSIWRKSSSAVCERITSTRMFTRRRLAADDDQSSGEAANGQR